MENPFEIINERLATIEKLLEELILEKQVPNVTAKSGKELMNVPEVAEYLSLAVQTIYGLIHKLEIPNYKQGRRVYFKKSEIDYWISTSRRKTRAEIESEVSNYLIRKRCKF